MARKSPQPNVLGSGSLSALSPLFWLLVVATGAGAGVGGGLLMLLLRGVQQLAWPYRPGDDFLSAVENATPLRIVSVVTAAGLLAGLAGLVGFILRRGTSGGHGGDLAEKIWSMPAGLNPCRRSFVRCFRSSSSGWAHRSAGESAPKQTGALVASILAQWTGLPDGQRRLLAACGAGAGIAAVYNVPFGGAMFALEVLLGTVSLPLVPPALAASLIATATSWLFLPNAPTYDIPFYPVSLDQIVWSLFAGPLAGLACVAYVRLIAVADRLQPRGVLALIAPVPVFAALGGFAIWYPQVLGNGKDVVQQAFLGQLGLPLLAVLLVAKPLATAACLGSGAPGGLFTPTLTAGAVLGGLLGHFWLAFWPGTPEGVFAIIGACAVLAASTQGPVSAVVLTFELTRRLDTLMVPAILATAGAVFIARLLEHRSIYSARIHLGRSAAERAARQKEQKGFIALSSAARFPELLRTLLRAVDGNQPVYVVAAHGRLLGEVPVRRVCDPAPDTLPLETAAAADFAIPVEPILASDDAATIARKFAAVEGDCLPVVEQEGGKLVGIRRRTVVRADE